MNAQWYTCALPDFDFDPSVAYDLIAYNDAGRQTFSGLVRYTSAPTLLSVDQCIDRGELYEIAGIGVRCPAGTTITLRGARFPVADAVTVQYDTIAYLSPPVSIALLSPTLINSSTITATLPALDTATAAAVYGAYGSVRAVFTASNINTTTNELGNSLYITSSAPNITSVSSDMCDSVSLLQLTNCRAVASITVVGSNLWQDDDMLLATSVAGVYQGWNFLLSSNSSIQYSSTTNTSLVFTLAYFDADTNIQLRPNVVYTLFLISITSHLLDASNAFRLSLTYNTVGTDSHSSSSGLSSGAIAGIVVAAVVVAALLVLAVVWLVRRHGPGSSPAWSNKSVSEGLQWSTQSAAQSPSDEYKDVEMR